MWILNQTKDKLIEVSSVLVFGCYVKTILPGGYREFILGEYSSPQRAQEVLLDITADISNSLKKVHVMLNM